MRVSLSSVRLSLAKVSFLRWPTGGEEVVAVFDEAVVVPFFGVDFFVGVEFHAALGEFVDHVGRCFL